MQSKHVLSDNIDFSIINTHVTSFYRPFNTKQQLHLDQCNRAITADLA